MQNNLKVAVTGGIGSGKTTVCKIIAAQGYNVVSCDEIYKELLRNSGFFKLLSERFEGVVTGGVLDKKKLSNLVFSDAEKLKQLNDLTHPVIMQNALSKMQSEGINFCEVPLLFEGGYEKLFDKVIVVLRDTAARVDSVAERDGLDKPTVEKRIKNQINYDNYDFKDYFILHNDGTTDKLREDTFQILKNLKN